MAFITDINKILEIVLNDDSEEDIDLGDGSGSENALDSDWEYEEEDPASSSYQTYTSYWKCRKCCWKRQWGDEHQQQYWAHHQSREPAAINSNEFVTSSSSVILGQTFIVLS